MRLGFVLRGLAVTGTTLALAGVTSVPAIAQPQDVTIQIQLFDKSVAPGQPYAPLLFAVTASKDVTISGNDKVEFSFGHLGPPGILMLETPSTPNECSGFVCRYAGGNLRLRPQPRFFQFQHLFLAGGTAAPGATGQLKITMRINDVVVATDTATLTVGESVDLRYAAQTGDVSVPFGERLPLDVGVRNVGEIAVHGAYLLFDMSPEVVSTTKHSNCNYDDDDRLQWCRFDGDLAPGQNYVARPALKIRPDAASPVFREIGLTWFTPIDWEQYGAELRARMHGAPGTGAALSLDQAPSTSRNLLLPQPDRDRLFNTGMVKLSITGEQKADLAAVGATAAGQLGSVVKIRVGVENRGPATSDGWFTSITFYPPAATTVTTAPSGCERQLGNDGLSFYCPNLLGLSKGERTLLTFALRIDSAAAGAPGKVRVNAESTLDADPANNEVDVDVVIVRDTLPVTGIQVTWVAAAGVLVLGAGLLLLRLFRRRPAAASLR